MPNIIPIRASYCISVVIDLEVGNYPNGGYSNNSMDPGGETKWGICKRDHPDVDIFNLTIQDAVTIYYTDYWLKSHCDQLLVPLDLYFYDAGVSQGNYAAVQCLQKACGIVQDGLMGPVTIKAASRVNPKRYLAERARRYMTLPEFVTFGNGWLIRLFTLCTR